MSRYSEQNREVIYHILELLPTIEEALQHMQLQLDELRLEESAVLFTDTALAIGSIANTILPLLMSDNDHELIQPIADMRESIAMLIDAYEQQNITTIQFVLAQRLIPSFLAWQHELGQRIRPAVLS